MLVKDIEEYSKNTYRIDNGRNQKFFNEVIYDIQSGKVILRFWTDNHFDEVVRQIKSNLHGVELQMKASYAFPLLQEQHASMPLANLERMLARYLIPKKDMKTDID